MKKWTVTWCVTDIEAPDADTAAHLAARSAGISLDDWWPSAIDEDEDDHETRRLEGECAECRDQRDEHNDSETCLRCGDPIVERDSDGRWVDENGLGCDGGTEHEPQADAEGDR